jgi:hypothetical protein
MVSIRTKELSPSIRRELSNGRLIKSYGPLFVELCAVGIRPQAELQWTLGATNGHSQKYDLICLISSRDYYREVA